MVVGGGHPVGVLLEDGVLQACPRFPPCSHPGLLDETYRVAMTVCVSFIPFMVSKHMLVCNDNHG